MITTLVCGLSFFWLLCSAAAVTTTTELVHQTTAAAVTDVLTSFSERRCKLWDALEASETITAFG